MITFEVAGTPAPKGSYRAMIVRGRAMLIPGGSSVNQKALREWDRDVKQHLAAMIGEGRTLPIYVATPLIVNIVFKLARVKSHFGKNGNLLPSAPKYPITKPDLDKLARSTLDAMTGVIYDDDSCIVDSHIQKQFAAVNSLAEHGHVGAVITVATMPPLQGALF